MIKYSKQENGYFTTKVWDGTYSNGKKHYKYIRSSKSSKDLEAKVKLFMESIDQRKYVSRNDILFHDYAVQWLKVYKADASPNTINMYRNVIDKHLSVDVPISLVRRNILVDVANNSKGARTRQQIVLTLKQICKSAVRDKLMSQTTFDDIFTDTIKVKYKAPEKRALYPHEKEALKNANFSDRERAFVYILYYCGLRRGEACALTANDIDFDKKLLNVDKAVYFDVNDPIVKDTKNGKHRVVPIPNEAISALYEYVSEGHVFHMSNGKIITKSSLDKMWKSIISKMNAVSSEPIEGLTPHIFRHNYCATLCGQIPTISINRIAELLGDSKQMVVDVYNHSIESKEKVDEILNSAF